MATVAALYRVRWQVEPVIKRMKSVLDIDKLRARENSILAELYLPGGYVNMTLDPFIYSCATRSLLRSHYGQFAQLPDA